jgi:predicted O-linked N-acetylglucosamine transferase (SPINDLY family)
MEYIKTKVVHSQSNTAWNVIGDQLACKYKIARIPYLVVEGSEILTTQNKHEALTHAQFISRCFNNSDKIIGNIF